MRRFLESMKRWVFGPPIATDAAKPAIFRSRVAVAVFGASILSAAVYAPDAVVDALRRGGQLSAIPLLVAGVVLVMVILALAYRSNVMFRSDARADYGLVKDTLGARPAVVTGAALLVDYIFTVTVSVAAMSHVVVAMVPAWDGVQPWLAVIAIVIMTVASLRGVRDRARVLVATWVAFVIVVVGLGILGAARLRTTTVEPLTPELPSTWAIVVALAAAVASGAVMVTGLEHLAASGPHHEPPQARRAGRTIVAASLTAAVAFSSVMLLAWAYRLTGESGQPVLVRVADRIIRTDAVLWVVAVAAVAVLYAAAAAVFKRFSHLAALLSRDGYLPRQLGMLNQRLVFRGAVLIVSTVAVGLVLATQADVVQLVHMYVIGVFAAITLSQLAMVRALVQASRAMTSGPDRRRMMARTALHGIAAAVATVVWVVVAVVNFLYGAWVAIAMIAWLVAMMHAIARHYDRVKADLTIVPGDRSGALPAATHGIVLVAQLHRPAMRALAYAKAARHSSLRAVGVQIDHDAARRLEEEWSQAHVGVPLVMLDSPYRDLVAPVLDYVRSLHRSSPRDVVVVYVPEYIVGNWWERFLHNRATVRLRSMLLRETSVIVAAVPWHLESWRSHMVAHDD